jgi:ubiquinol-cytochrome c reductase iron-sulfur subunit
MRGEMLTRACLILAIVAVLASAVSAALHADPAVVGWLIALAFAAVAAWAGTAALALRAPDDLREPRHRPVVTDDEVAVTRSGAFGWLSAAALGAFALAGIVPLISLGRRGSVPRGTAWTRGARLVTADGHMVRADDVSVGGVTTVFPEGHVDAHQAAALLIRVEDDAMLTDHALAPHGNVAFSKICTHAGCPVAIYRHADYTLYCPCHQSEFAVLFGAKPVAGPATRALPELGLAVDADGYLVARGDFNAPVGPDDWNRPA